MIDFLLPLIKEAGKQILTAEKIIRGKKEGGGSWVTEADLRSERYIIETIQKKFPTHAILSEESASVLPEPEKKDDCWIIDPLDGTTNATRGIPFFGVSIAYGKQDTIMAGAVYDPLRDELFWAEKGKGAWCNGEKMILTNTAHLAGAIINIGSPYKQETFKKTYPLGEKLHESGARIVNFGSAVLELCYVAKGRLFGYVECGLKPWDVAAGSLILEEAGGHIEGYSSSSFSFFCPEELIAGTATIVAEIKQVLS